MRESPRIRRLRTDLKALERLRDESSILDFLIPQPLPNGPPEAYLVRFRGIGLWRPSGSGEVLIREQHEVSIRLGASYPRMMPELAWKTPIFHPNISAGGVVCLGGYGLHWVPSLNLDELCVMLWDMVRYANFDVKSAYNREAALWARDQTAYRLPVDPRPLRDRIAGLAASAATALPPRTIAATPVPAADVLFIDGEAVVDAEIVESEDSDVLFIE